MSERRPSLDAVLLKLAQVSARDLYTMIPGKVVKWDAGKQRANVQILVKEPYTDEDGNRRLLDSAIVTGVPVQFPGAGGFRVTFPISDGTLTINGQNVKATTGSLIFAHRSMDKWLTGDGKVVDPEYDHAHGQNDAVFMPGLMPFGAPWQDVPTDHATIGSDTGVQIHFHADVATAAKASDEASAQYVALANLVNSELSAIQTTLESLTGGAGSPAEFGTPYIAGDTSAEQFKAK